MPKVAFVKVDYSKGIEHAVRKAMQLANWKKYVKEGKIFVKINAMGNQFVPGLNTSPFILGATLKILRENLPKTKIFVGDADLATVRQLEQAAKLWGYKKIVKKYKCKWINLSEQELVEKYVGGKVFESILVPKIVEEVNYIISLPVIKTHGLTKITCALKNSWGFLPRYRHQYHMVADLAIAEMNRAVKVDFAIVDGTICMEGPGPRTGKPKICDVILAGSDLVAIDCVVAKFMGLNPKKIGHIVNAEKLGIGTTKDVKIVGDKFFVAGFEPPKQNIVFFFEKRFRKLPIVKKLFFDTKLFDFFSWVVTQYNTRWWWWKVGRKALRKILEHEFYGKLYREIVEKINF
jgi:uncharacterized protein (DUF362 family)